MDRTSVTRLGNFLDFGQLSNYLATINLPKSPTFFGNFCKGVKIYHFSSEIIFGQLLQTFGDIFLVTQDRTNTQVMSRANFSVFTPATRCQNWFRYESKQKNLQSSTCHFLIEFNRFFVVRTQYGKKKYLEEKDDSAICTFLFVSRSVYLLLRVYLSVSMPLFICILVCSLCG